jgi:hypothetical protein
MNNKVDKIVEKINKSKHYDDETKAKKIARFEEWRNSNEGLLDYDTIYRVFDHPYYRVMHNALNFTKGVKYETKLYKYEGDNEIEIPVGRPKKRTKNDTEKSEVEAEKNTEESTSEELTKYKVLIKVTKNDVSILELEHVDDTSKLREAKSEAAYKVLEKKIYTRIECFFYFFCFLFFFNSFSTS